MKTSTLIIAIIGIAIIGYLVYKYEYLPRKTSTSTTTTSSNTLGTTSSSSTTQSSITSTNKNILTTKSQQLQQILKNSIVHKGNPTTISTGIGKTIHTVGGTTNLNQKLTINRNSYSYIQQIEKINKPFTKIVKMPPITYGSNNSNDIIHTPKLPHLPGLPTLSELKKQNPYLR
ncbi:MAG: hypothetical protein QXP04_04635 [Candidatus Nanoarchaeia archaeon]|nr:hypothetical protein [Candidatus Jingweiarchaeum tengchongense]